MRNFTLALATCFTGLVAGLFFGFSVAINPAFTRLPDAGYIVAMQAINEAIENPVFGCVFAGTPLFLVLATVLHGHRPFTRRFGLLLAASAVYLIGGLGVTVFVNIPLNVVLAQVPLQASPADKADTRTGFASTWNRWHTVRTWAGTVAFALAVGACLAGDSELDRTVDKQA